MNYPFVEILMTTYNGEAYIRNQLDSLLIQTYPHWRLTIHDDGSQDATLAIIDDYCRKDKRIILLDDGLVGLGTAKNYLHLMRQVDGEYYMFCDQDDIWFEDKIRKMLDAIRKYQQPAMVYSNSFLYINGKVTSQYSTIIHPSTVRDTLFFNSGIQGCSIIMNDQLMRLLKPYPDTVVMHDHLITMAAASFGRIGYLAEGLMLYRQHALNVTGNQSVGYWHRIKSFFSGRKSVISKSHFDANKAFYQQYHDLLSESTKTLYHAYFKYAYCTSVFGRLGILFKYGFTLGNRRWVLLLKTIIRKPIV